MKKNACLVFSWKREVTVWNKRSSTPERNPLLPLGQVISTTFVVPSTTSIVWSDVGTAVGESVGTAVGPAVVGLNVGNLVGTADGVAEGPSVGSAVGEAVITTITVISA